MATVKRYEFPHADAISVKLEEGAITRGDIEDGGLIIKDVITARVGKLKKGDLVKFTSDQNSGGEIVMEKDFNNQSQIEIDLSSYSNGIYFVKIISDEIIQMKKIILQK